MLRWLLQGLAWLHLGPGVAFAVLAFGCDGATQNLLCGGNAVATFAVLTGVAWLVIGGAMVALELRRRHE